MERIFRFEEFVFFVDFKFFDCVLLQLAPHPSTIGLMTDFDGKFKCWHEMWSCGDIVVCQVTRQFQNGAEAKAWGVRHVNHNGERKPDEKIFPPNMMVNTVYQCRPSPLSERLWSVGQNFHLFRNRELDNCTDTPLQAIILKAIAKDKAPLSLNTFNAFFVKNNCVHKVYIQGSGNINGDLLVIFSQLLCEFLAQEEVKTYKAHVVHRIMLHDNIRRKYEQMLNKIGSLSLELEEQGKKELALNSVLSNDLQTLQSIASMFQNQLFDPTVVLMPANAEGVLGKMLKWPTDQVFPAIDLATLLALTRDGARLLTVRLRAVPVMIDILNRDMKSARNVSLVLKVAFACLSSVSHASVLSSVLHQLLQMDR